MGADRPGQRHHQLPQPLTTDSAALVVPAVPTFSVDKGFWYNIPDHLQPDVVTGTRVRVPLGGRKVRGYVIETGATTGDLKDILGISGETPVFDSDLLKALRWAAQHYVAPISVLLEKAAPPTLPKRVGHRAGTQTAPIPNPSPAHPLDDLISSLSTGERHPPVAYGVHWSDTSWMDVLGALVSSGRSIAVVAPTMTEAGRISDQLEERYRQRLVRLPDSGDSKLTRAWEKSHLPGSIIVGTPRLAYWPIPGLGLAVVVEEGRRAMKERQTPTIHVREMLRTRSRIEGFGVLFVGPTPSVELIAGGAELIQPGRPWGLVEIVDRTDDPPGSGFLSERTVSALKASAQGGQRAFVFTHIRAVDASARCVSCRRLRRCQRCGSHIGQRPACPRCQQHAGPCANCGGIAFESMGSVPARIVAELEKRVGKHLVGLIDSAKPIEVGTERDLAGLSSLGLAVAVDVDSLLYGSNYRASEEALRILARLVGSVMRRKGFRTILQTSSPDSPLISALRRGEPIPYLEAVLAERARDGFPPATEMMALEVSGLSAEVVTAAIQRIAPGMVMGPVPVGERNRWLLQGDLKNVKTEMRSVVQRLRDTGGTVRVDVDPIDL